MSCRPIKESMARAAALCLILLALAAPSAWAEGAPDAAALAASAGAELRPVRVVVAQRAGIDPLTIPRGPVEVRDEFIPAQLRLTLPATTPDPAGRGRWRLRAHFDWGSDFSFSQTGPAEDPASDRRFIVDGEHRTFELAARYGLSDTVDVGIRIPVQWRGAGVMDAFIDWFHEVFPSDDNDRPFFDRDRYRVEGRDGAGAYSTWNDAHGTGLGNVELLASWAVVAPRARRDWRVALIGRLGLPTGTGPFVTGSVDVGVQVALAKQIVRRWDVYGGFGGTYYSSRRTRGWEYLPLRAYGFLAIEYRPWSRVSILLQSDYGSRLIGNIREYPAVQWYVQVGAKYDLSARWRAVLGITENIIDQQSTLDVSIWLGLETTF